jgi:hypothetical protein
MPELGVSTVGGRCIVSETRQKALPSLMVIFLKSGSRRTYAIEGDGLAVFADGSGKEFGPDVVLLSVAIPSHVRRLSSRPNPNRPSRLVSLYFNGSERSTRFHILISRI